MGGLGLILYGFVFLCLVVTKISQQLGHWSGQ